MRGKSALVVAELARSMVEGAHSCCSLSAIRETRQGASVRWAWKVEHFSSSISISSLGGSVYTDRVEDVCRLLGWLV